MQIMLHIQFGCPSRISFADPISSGGSNSEKEPSSRFGVMGGFAFSEIIKQV